MKHVLGERHPCAAGDGEACTFESMGAFADKSEKVGEVTVLRCTRCGIGISMPPIADVAFLYEGRESQDFQPDSRGISHKIKNLAFRRQARQLLRQLGRAPERIADFGCGSGQFTRCLAETAKSAGVSGCDFHADPPDELSANSYFPMTELPAHRGGFDLVLAMHVLEHDDDADALLARITSLAGPGGTIVLEVPNIDCFWAGLLGKAWDAWYLPFHRTHFSRTALRALIERGGLCIEQDLDICVPTMGRSVANALGARNNLFFLLVGVALHPLQWLGEWLTSRPSAIRIIARKN